MTSRSTKHSSYKKPRDGKSGNDKNINGTV